MKFNDSGFVGRLFESELMRGYQKFPKFGPRRASTVAFPLLENFESWYRRINLTECFAKARRPRWLPAIPANNRRKDNARRSGSICIDPYRSVGRIMLWNAFFDDVSGLWNMTVRFECGKQWRRLSRSSFLFESNYLSSRISMICWSSKPQAPSLSLNLLRYFLNVRSNNFLREISVRLDEICVAELADDSARNTRNLDPST